MCFGQANELPDHGMGYRLDVRIAPFRIQLSASLFHRLLLRGIFFSVVFIILHLGWRQYRIDWVCLYPALVLVSLPHNLLCFAEKETNSLFLPFTDPASS